MRSKTLFAILLFLSFFASIEGSAAEGDALIHAAWEGLEKSCEKNKDSFLEQYAELERVFFKQLESFSSKELVAMLENEVLNEESMFADLLLTLWPMHLPEGAKGKFAYEVCAVDLHKVHESLREGVSKKAKAYLSSWRSCSRLRWRKQEPEVVSRLSYCYATLTE